MISKKTWEAIGFNPTAHWAWMNIPLAPKPDIRLLDGHWVIEAFHGLVIGKFPSKKAAGGALAMLILVDAAIVPRRLGP